MAKPSELAAVIAQQFDAEEPTIRQMARTLRDHGYMAKERAGRGAGTLTSLDAANLLIAAAVGRSVKDSPAAVEAYGAMVAMHPIIGPEGEILPWHHRFSDGLAALLDFTAKNLDSFMKPHPPNIQVTLLGIHPMARIDATLPDFNAGTSYVGPNKYKIMPDLHVTTEFTFRTIASVARLLVPSPPAYMPKQTALRE